MRQIRIRRKSRRPFRCLTAGLIATLITALFASPALAAAPGNDEFDTAATVERLPFTDKLDATNATESENDPATTSGTRTYPLCHEGGTVWYRFTPNRDVRLVADTFDSDFNTVLGAFAGSPTEDNMIECNDDWRSSQSRVSFEAKAGQTYNFIVSGHSPGLLVFNLRAATPPSNDDFGRAKTIRVQLPFKDEVDTTDATLNVNDPSCSGRARSVWYRYTRPEKWGDRRIELSTRGSNYYTALSVYTGPRHALNQTECDSGGYRSKVRFPAEAGETYWVMIGAANNSQGGSLTLRAKNMPLPFRLRFGLGNTGRISSVTGAIHVGGHLACNKKTQADIEVHIRQQRPSGKVKTAHAYKDVACGKRRPWDINLMPSDRLFNEGPAGVWVTVSVPSRDRERSEKKLVDLKVCDRCL